MNERRRSESHLALAQRVGRIGSWEVTVPGPDVHRWNAAYLSDEVFRILGVDPGALEVSAGAFLEHVHPEDRERLLEGMARVRESAARMSFDFRILRSDGEVRQAHSEAEFTREAKGGPVRIVGTLQDVTEQRAAQERGRRIEEQLRQAQKMEAVGRLVGGVAHDFNNLLGVITGYAQMLGRELGEAHPGHKRLAQIERAAVRASELTRRLLAFSRAQPADPRPIDLAVLIADMEPMLRRMIGEDVSLVVASEARLWSVRADPGQIEQAIMNLVVNARDAMPRGGRITITTRNVDSSSQDDKPAIELQVSDTGEGMSPEVRGRAFEPFFTTKESGKGTGLGLPMAYAAVEQAGGRIEVTSEPGAGATFRILLPRCAEPPDAPAPAAPAHDAPGGPETILLVEDDLALREMVRETLEASGYRVLEADGPAQAEAHSDAEAGAIDLLLSDVVMPEGGGQEVLDALRQRRPAIRALFMSGYCDETLGPRGVAAGSHVLFKPFSTQALLRAVRESLQTDPG